MISSVGRDVEYQPFRTNSKRGPDTRESLDKLKDYFDPDTRESLDKLTDYFDTKFRSLKRELARDAEESERKKVKLEKTVEFKYKSNQISIRI